MKRSEFIEKCFNVLEDLNAPEYVLKLGTSCCELVFEYKHHELYKIMDVISFYFPYSCFLKSKLSYQVMCFDKIIVIRLLE